MTSTYETLRSRLQSAFDALEIDADPALRTSDRSDYQANGVMALAKRLGRPPREVAEEIVTALDVDGVATVEIAGPGFLNLTLETSFLDDQLRALPEGGGQVSTGDGGWAWAYPLRSIAGPIGHMVACAPGQPTGEEQFLAQVVAQQTPAANPTPPARAACRAARLRQCRAAPAPRRMPTWRRRAALRQG